jgi:hypothetical protein
MCEHATLFRSKRERTAVWFTNSYTAHKIKWSDDTAARPPGRRPASDPVALDLLFSRCWEFQRPNSGISAAGALATARLSAGF